MAISKAVLTLEVRMRRTTLDNAPGWALELLENSRVGHLGLTDEVGSPRVMPVTYVVHDGALWTVVDNKPKQATEPVRVRWLRARPAAALTVDHYDDEWTRLAWVQILGDVVVLDVRGAPDAVTALAAKYAQYVDDPPPGPLLQLRPQRVLCWSAAQR
jgi:PPOX class probable F420-dependent enzyme